jgi:hypothetical protein
MTNTDTPEVSGVLSTKVSSNGSQICFHRYFFPAIQDPADPNSTFTMDLETGMLYVGSRNHMLAYDRADDQTAWYYVMDLGYMIDSISKQRALITDNRPESFWTTLMTS